MLNLDIVLFSLGVQGNATTYSPVFDTAGANYGAFDIVADTKTGAATLDLTIEDSNDGTNFATHVTFTQITANGKAIQRDSGFSRFVRAKLVAGGGAGTSFSLRVLGHLKER